MCNHTTSRCRNHRRKSHLAPNHVHPLLRASSYTLGNALSQRCGAGSVRAQTINTNRSRWRHFFFASPRSIPLQTVPSASWACKSYIATCHSVWLYIACRWWLSAFGCSQGVHKLEQWKFVGRKVRFCRVFSSPTVPSDLQSSTMHSLVKSPM